MSAWTPWSPSWQISRVLIYNDEAQVAVQRSWEGTWSELARPNKHPRPRLKTFHAINMVHNPIQSIGVHKSLLLSDHSLANTADRVTMVCDVWFVMYGELFVNTFRDSVSYI